MQLYIPLDPATQLLNQNFMPGSQLLQRPASNVIPAGSLQAASTSFYTTGSGGGKLDCEFRRDLVESNDIF